MYFILFPPPSLSLCFILSLRLLPLHSLQWTPVHQVAASIPMTPQYSTWSVPRLCCYCPRSLPPVPLRSRPLLPPACPLPPRRPVLWVDPYRHFRQISLRILSRAMVGQWVWAVRVVSTREETKNGRHHVPLLLKWVWFWRSGGITVVRLGSTMEGFLFVIFYIYLSRVFSEVFLFPEESPCLSFLLKWRGGHLLHTRREHVRNWNFNFTLNDELSR